jgi:hypothetical protein
MKSSDAKPEAVADALGVDGGTCGSLTLTAPPITPVVMHGAVPAATGGAILAGTYFLTAVITYEDGGAPGGAIDGELELTAAAVGFDYIEIIKVGFTVGSSAGTLTTSGTTETSTPTCPPSTPGSVASYTFDSTTMTLTLYSGKVAEVFTLQ